MKGAFGGPEYLAGSCAVITGGGGDLGLASARALGTAGARVVLVDSSEPALSAAEDHLSGLGVLVDVLAADVRDAAAYDRLLALDATANGVDILVNAAGVQSRQSTSDLDMSEFDRLWEINVRALVALTKAVLPAMIAKRSGAIVNFCSVGSFIGLPGKVAYATTKGAVAQFTRTLAVEVASLGVRCNGIAPGMFLTNMTREMLDAPAALQRSLRNIPMGRLGDAATDLGGLILLLAGPAGAYINGEIVRLDGGRLAGG